MDRNMRNQFAGFIFQLAMQNLQQIWQAETILDSDDYDDEEENATILQAYTFLKEKAISIDSYVENTVSNFSEQEFQSHFRLCYAAFEALENSLAPELTLHSQIIPVRKQLLSILWLLATPDSFSSIGERFNLSKGSLYNCFLRVVKALNKIANGIIRWPSVTFRNQIKEQFKSLGGLDGVIGAIDGTLIEIKARKAHAQGYTGQKCFHTMQLQAIAIPDLKFIDIFTGYPGSIGDRQVFEKSNIYGNIVSNKDQYFEPGEYIVGDKDYPVLSWCLPPYVKQGKLTQTQVNFNVMHAKTRRVVERAFALLFGRYRRLKYLDMNKLNITPATIFAICVLHNICLDHADLEFNEQAIADGENYMASQQQKLQATGKNPTATVAASDDFINKEGLMFRNYLAQNLVP